MIRTITAYRKFNMAPLLFVAASAISMSAYAEDEPLEVLGSNKSAQEYWKDFKHDSDEKWGSAQEAFRDGWLESKLETAMALSEDLRDFDIHIEVGNSTAEISGEVGSRLAKERATLVALDVDGIDRVLNRLKVKNDAPKLGETEGEQRSIMRTVGDAAITTEVKTKLLADTEVGGFGINVDTYRGKVTLSGTVGSRAERALAEYIAASSGNVLSVKNDLEVRRQLSQR